MKELIRTSTNHHTVIIVGGGQSGLSMSHGLTEKGIDHLIFEKNQIGHSWLNNRWDTFCLVTPNWQCQLPGYPYTGTDPHGFMQKNEIVQYIKSYADFFNPPIKEGVEVFKIRKNETQDTFEVKTSIGEYTADQVVIAVGGYHLPKLPRLAEKFPETITQIHSSQYKNPEQLPQGGVLVVGTGQSGCQIAEDLHLAGRKVHLCVGSAPRSPRRYRGKDVVDWLDQMGYYDLSIEDHPQKEKARTNTNHYVTGRDGGREIDLRQFALEGMELHGRLKALKNNKLEFFNDLSQNLDNADAVAENIKKTIDSFISNNQIEAPLDHPYQPVWQPNETMLEIDYLQANISAVVWSTGYHSDFSWIEVPVFDGKGYPSHKRGVTPVSGFYFLGLPWLYTWGSGRFSGVARDADYLVDSIVARQSTTHSKDSNKDWSIINEFLLGS